MTNISKIGSMLFALLFVLTISMTAKDKEVTLKTNMKCEACKTKIEDGLKSQKGITSASADLASNTITINYDDKETNSSKLTKAVKDLGFNADTNPNAKVDAKSCSTEEVKSCSTDAKKTDGKDGGCCSSKGLKAKTK